MTATSSAAGGGTVTVTLQMCDDFVNRGKYRIHFDTEAPFASDGPTVGPVCQTTSDDTLKLSIRGATTKFTGPAFESFTLADNVANGGDDFIEWVVSYAALGLVGGEDIEPRFPR